MAELTSSTEPCFTRVSREKNVTSNQFMDLHFSARCFAAIGLGIVALPIFSFGAHTASDLAAGLRAKQEGSTFVRVRMQVGSEKILQLQIKSRVSSETSDIVYQILFPKERKGESVLLHRSGHKFSGTLFTPPDNLKPIGSAEMKHSLFGSDLSYEDIIDSPFAWSQQAIVGTEDVSGTPCQILESKPGKGHTSSYSSVKSWVDPLRLVPLRIEKYDTSGKVVRRINTTRISLDGGDSLPADLKVYGSRSSVTQIAGSRIKRGLSYADTEFTPEGLKELNAPPGSGSSE
jgi:Outer membrane lipoprotein-sorting protein